MWWCSGDGDGGGASYRLCFLYVIVCDVNLILNLIMSLYTSVEILMFFSCGGGGGCKLMCGCES